ncbi:hypothetical protein T484DRAFT_2022069, partial [Baffinella frigidus]
AGRAQGSSWALSLGGWRCSGGSGGGGGAAGETGPGPRASATSLACLRWRSAWTGTRRGVGGRDASARCCAPCGGTRWG